MITVHTMMAIITNMATIITMTMMITMTIGGHNNLHLFSWIRNDHDVHNDHDDHNFHNDHNNHDDQDGHIRQVVYNSSPVPTIVMIMIIMTIIMATIITTIFTMATSGRLFTIPPRFPPPAAATHRDTGQEQPPCGQI